MKDRDRDRAELLHARKMWSDIEGEIIELRRRLNELTGGDGQRLLMALEGERLEHVGRALREALRQ